MREGSTLDGHRQRTRPGRALARLGAIAALLLATASTAAPLTPYTDAELIDGFMRTVFGMERTGDGLHPGGDVVKKFNGPVPYHLVPLSSTDARETVRGFLAGLDHTIQNLTLTETSSAEAARMILYLVDRSQYAATVLGTAWDGVDTHFLTENACSAVLAARTTGIDLALVYIVVDEGFERMSHCLVEEVAQSLGPANDSPDLADSIFNDDSDISVLGVFDWFLLNMLYDDRIRAGMTAADVLPLLPAVIADTRARLLTVADPALAAHDAALNQAR